MTEGSFVFVDIETNGGSGERGRVIEVAAIKIIHGQMMDTFQSLVNPGGGLPHWITGLTGITESDLVGAPYFEDIAAQLYEFLEGSIFVAHNVLFDYSFLKRHFAETGYRYAPKLFCTVKLSRAMYPEYRGHSLEKIIERHDVSVENRHRALDDARAMYEFVKIAINQKGQEAFDSNLKLQLKTRSLPPNVDEKVILGLPETNGIYIFEDDRGEPLYVGKSVNIRARVRSHFTNATSIAKELRMSLQSHNVSYIKTETEIEALLLESMKVKELQPIFNRKLRRQKSQSLIVKSDMGNYLTFSIENHDLSEYSDLAKVYGVFSNRRQAKLKLEETARAYQLCPKLLGLEPGKGECFRRQLGLCRGACVGLESAASYNQRVEFALDRLKIAAWPYGSKVSVPISATRSLIVDQWTPIGLYDAEDDNFTEIEGGFDMDTYKIIRSYIRTKKPVVSKVG